MSTIHLSNYGISITPGKMDAVNREIQQKIQIGEPFELDFDGVEGLDTRAAYALLEPLRKHYGKDYRKYVSFSNVAPMVNNALIFSGTTTPNAVISNPRTPKHSFTSAFSRIFATILLLLTLGVGQMWADSGFFSTGQWKIGYNDGSDHWIDYQDDGATVDLGIKTQLSLIGCNVNTWGSVKTNLDWWKSFSSSLDAVDNGTGNFWSIYADWDGNHEWYMDCNDYDMIAGASNNPGNNTLYMRWSLRNYNTKTGQAKITFTIPGFTTTSTSQIFNNTTVSSNSSETISFGTHYGTALTTSNCSITGTNNSDFSVIDIDESGVTVKFMPSAIGSRSATLTITDAHSKTCTITLSGTGTAPAETTHSVTVSYVCTSPSATVSTATTPTIGEVTYSSQTAPSVAGYTFVNWTLGDGVSKHTSDALTDNPIRVKTLSSGSYTMQANYTEDLSSTWKICGGTNLTGDNWTEHAMTKKTGHSTESIVYYTFNISSTNNGITGTANDWSFKIKNGETWYGLTADGSYWWTSSTTANQTLSTSGANIQLCANVAGTYEVKVDYTTPASPKITVTFPTSYTVNFGVSPTGAADAPTNDKSVSNGGLVLSGTSVTFTHGDAKTGYTWSHWDVGGENVCTGSTYTTSITAATTVTAVYTEDTHTVTVAKDATGGGNISTTSVSAGVATASATITATPANLAWRFKNWTVPDGVTIASGSTTSASITINATEDGKTITANFEPRYGLVGSRLDGTTADGMPLWTEAADFVVTSFTDKDNMSLTCTRTLSANKDYKFQVYDRESDSRRGGDNDAKMTLGESWKLTGSGLISFDTKGAGDYTFEITKIDNDTYHPSIQINAPTSYTVTFDKGTGGSAVTASGSVSGSITSGQYVAEGEDITFTQTADEGYTFKGWYDAASGGSAISSMASDNVLDNIAANATVYAQYTENMTTVTLASTTGGHIEIGGEEVPSTTAGVYTTRSITAVPDEGWYFAGWTVSDGADCKVASTDGRNDNESQTTVLSGLGAGTTGVVTANFVENDKIYFRNIFDDGEGNVTRWESVYVHFDITWTEHDGKQAVQTSSDNISKGLHCSMTKIGTSDVYWAYVPRYITTNSKTRVAFADHDDSYNDSKLWEGNAAGRGDYNPLLNMFVPHHTKLYSTNSVDYYSNGYWMKYDTRASQGAGYYLKVYNSRNNYTEKGEFTADTDDATIIQYQVRIDNVAADHTRFMITSAGGLNYLAAATPTSIANSDIDLNEDTRATASNDVYFQLTATSEGFYTFIIDQTGDKMKLTVDYPVSPGDYRLKHTYSGRNKANMADSTYTTYSDVIKASTAGTAKTYSMYLNSASATLVLQECTSINETTTLPEWNDGIATNLDGLLTKVGIDGNGVYQFDITVNTTSHQVNTVTNIGKYTGNYYIKTDCATGGWVNYTSNAMEANTINATAAGYDYYYCKWVGNTSTNVKCVIANDYCNQLSDTLESDAILTRNGIAYQTLPYAANVRFSYNSSTNAINRTYLLGSSDANSFLRLKPAAAGYVFTSSDRSTDLYTTDTKFQDNGNWTYQMDVYVYQGAKGGVYTDYPTTSPITRQQLVDTINNELMGGTEGTTLYKVRMVYDYKTDYLMSAWMASGVQTQTIDLKSDFMYVRNAQKDADQLSFSNGATVSDAHKAYGAIELKYDSMVNQMSSWTAKAYRQCMYYISFPFDVNVSDIFGIGEMGTDWRIQKYNGAKRAQIGWFAETETFWEDLTEDSVMHAYEGYSLLLNRVKFNNSSSSVWTNISSGGSVFLYFPSATNVNALSHGTRTITVPEHKCTIDKTFGQDAGLANPRNHKYTDSNWNMVGAPLFQNLAATNIATGAVVGENNDSTFNYVYAWNSSDNTLGVRSTLSTSFVFNSMYAYMVQYAGDVTFTGAMLTPESVAARRKAENKDYTIELNLHKAETFSGRAYVELRENADDDYLLNEDMYMMRGSKTADLYTYAGSYDVAANVLSVDNHVVPIGVNVLSAGTYIFSMPSNFSGTVTLIDRAADTRTNLLLGDYEVYLPKGEQNDRFLLEINIRTVPTAIDGTQGGSLKDGQDHKYIENGTLRILHNGMLYDAQGHRVQ